MGFTERPLPLVEQWRRTANDFLSLNVFSLRLKFCKAKL
jgi:hypothetical protein